MSINNIRVENTKNITGEWFSLKKTKKEHKGKPLMEYLNLINFEDYHILKRTNKQRLVTKEDVYKFKFAGYLFLRKQEYTREHIEMWLDFIQDNKLLLPFLDRPFPSFPPDTKIEIIEF